MTVAESRFFQIVPVRLQKMEECFDSIDKRLALMTDLLSELLKLLKESNDE